MPLLFTIFLQLANHNSIIMEKKFLLLFQCQKAFFKYTSNICFLNQNHQLNQWFILPPQEAITDNAYKHFENPPDTLLPQLLSLAVIFICFYFFTRKWVNVLTKTDFLCHTVLFSLMIHVFFCPFSNYINTISSTPKCFISLFVF